MSSDVKSSLTTSYAELLERNSRFLWNPFTQMKDYLASEPLVIERAEGVKLVDANGVEYYDGNSSLWLNVHGHNRVELNQAITAQLEKVAHTTLLGMANVPALELAGRLVEITPPGLEKVFFSDSGATAVEIGLKIAYAYWRRVGRPEKRLFVAFDDAYHGDTVGAMSVGGIDLFHSEFGQLLFGCEHVSFPHAYRFAGTEAECAAASATELEALLAERGGEIACVVVEPLVQAAAGMRTMPKGFLATVARLCRQYDVLLLADEVATGFGRTGELFACEHEGVEPDLMTVGKGLTGGYLPVAATLTTDAVYDAFYADWDELKAMYHGHSFTGNQLGCAVALASLDLFESDGLVRHVQESTAFVAGRLAEVGELPHVGDVRQRGLMVGIELVADRSTKEPFDWQQRTGMRVCRRAQELGMITRPLGDVVVFMPPLATERDDLDAMLSILHRSIADVTGE